MSEPVSALGGVSFDSGIAEIHEVGPQGMITLRGDLSSAGLKKAVKAVAGVDVPAPGHANCVGDRGICWMSPDELLVLCPYTSVTAEVGKLTAALSKTHMMAVNVSDARASFRVSGDHARDVMAKLSPVDLSVSAFGPGSFRRTRMAQVPAAFWMADDGSFQIVCFRSQAQYVFDLLKVAAQIGSEVGYNSQ
ncbi:MAG: sarcosine oxidase subunit gamma family protein [Sulfitobacter sp.]